MPSLSVKSHVARDLLQSAQLFSLIRASSGRCSQRSSVYKPRATTTSRREH